jgi:hypothetical protein
VINIGKPVSPSILRFRIVALNERAGSVVVALEAFLVAYRAL